MATLSLTNQLTEKADIAPKILKLRTLLESRSEVWQKIPYEKRKAWLDSGKDPILEEAWTMYQYLRDNFFGRRFMDDDS